jgi:hypothetical protein
LDISLKHLKHLKITASPAATPYLLGNSSSKQARVRGTWRATVQHTLQAQHAGLSFVPIGTLDGAQAQASRASPSATGEVDGGKARSAERGAARDVAGHSGRDEGGREAQRSARSRGEQVCLVTGMTSFVVGWSDMCLSGVFSGVSPSCRLVLQVAYSAMRVLRET